MSVYRIEYNPTTRCKMMRPVTNREEYMALRDSSAQQTNLRQTRAGNDAAKRRLVQMNYSCIPNEDGTLRGSQTPSNTVGMDVDHIPREQMEEVKERILARKDELGLLMLELSARGEGFHLVFRRRTNLSQIDNLRWASDLLGVEFDDGAKDITRVFFTTTASEDDLIYLDDEIFANAAAESQSPVRATEHSAGCKPCVETGHTSSQSPVRATECGYETMPPLQGSEMGNADNKDRVHTLSSAISPLQGSASYLGIPYAAIIDKWWELYNDGQTPVKSNRNVLTFELAVNLRHICGFDRQLLAQVIPAYDGFSETEKMACIDSALSTKMTQMPRRLRDVLTELKKDNVGNDEVFSAIEEAEQEDDLYYYKRLSRVAQPLGIRESIKSTGPKMAIPVISVCCPMIGALATNVKVKIHGKVVQLNIHAFVVGEAASNKGDLDAIVDAWMVEQIALNALYFAQEQDYRNRKRQAKNKKEQPEEPHLPVRFLTMNNTVANLAERLANCDGKHAFSFTPEADTVAAKWRSSMCDFSTMLRQAYDGSRYDREAKSADATTVHIDHLLWNVCMCGTPDALYRVISNYTDGLLSRFVIAHTPDNTFAPLEEKPYLMTDALREKIGQVAHLLPFMQGTLDLPKLEERSRQWVERLRRDALKDDDRVRARARLRDHGTAMRMVACLILCAVAERLIKQHGLAGAERELKQNPNLTNVMAQKCQTPAMLEAYDVLADSLIENDMLYFRDKLECASGAGVMGSSERQARGKNDRVYDRLSEVFNFEQAMGAKGNGCSRNAVKQMLKNWHNQGLIEYLNGGRYQKIATTK